jgi:GT2 family glycosyltransferase
MTVPVSIIIPAFNELHYCQQCLNTLLVHTRRPYKLILVDNGSTDGVGEFFDAIPDACVVHAGSNRGFAGGVNLGLAQADGHVVLLNSDTLTPSGWLERLERALLSDDRIGIVGPMSNSVSGDQKIEGLSFTSVEAINAFAGALEERNRGVVQETTRLVGFCLMIRDRVLRDVGFFDEDYGIGNYEDDDYCVRTLQAGYRLGIARDAFVFHYGGRTFLGMGLTDDKWRALMMANERHFLAKWQAAGEMKKDEG